MAKAKKLSKSLPEALQVWVEARHRYRLTHAQVQMARELGLNPKKFGSLANQRQEPWKMPLPDYIAHLYQKRFGRPAPVAVLSLEERHAQQQRKKQERKERKNTNETIQLALGAASERDASEHSAGGQNYDDEIPF